MALNFDFYYGAESEQYRFYRIPRVLISHSYFKNLSTDSKLLYGMLLDRMSLSCKNGWMDEDGKVYIYYSLDEIQEDLNCGHDKAAKLLAELDTVKGVGLIERVKQGQGKPTMIYVKRFTTPELMDGDTAPLPVENPDTGRPEVQTSGNQRSEPPPQAALTPESIACEVPHTPKISLIDVKSEVKTSEKPKSRHRKTRSLDFGKTAPSNTYRNQTYLSQPYPSPTMPPGGREVGSRAECRSDLLEQLSYHVLCERHTPSTLDGIIDLLADALCTTRPTLRLNSEEVPMEAVRERLALLDFTHIEYAFDYLSHRTQPVGNPRAFLLTLLYNAPLLVEQYYDLEVQRDFANGLPLQTEFAARSA